MMYYLSITIAILASAVYHFSQKATPRGVNPPISLMVTYGIALVLTALLLYVMPAKGGLWAEIRRLNWASYLLAIAIVGLEVGFLLVYRGGWNIGTRGGLGQRGRLASSGPCGTSGVQGSPELDQCRWHPNLPHWPDHAELEAVKRT